MSGGGRRQRSGTCPFSLEKRGEDYEYLRSQARVRVCLDAYVSQSPGPVEGKSTPQCPDYFSSQGTNKTGVRRKKSLK